MATKVKLYSQNGAEKGDITLNKDIFEAKINEDLMHQAVVMIQANRRHPIAHTKIRGEIKSTTAKPFRQKGTGRARQGSRTNVHHKGGCVVFGPRNTRNFSKNMPKKQRRAALFSALSLKAKDGKILAVDSYDKGAKTKSMQEMLGKLPLDKTFLIVTKEDNGDVSRAAKNIQYTETVSARNLNTEKVLRYRSVLFVGDAFSALEDTFLKKATATPAEEN